MDSSVNGNSAEEEIWLLRRISEESPDAVIRIDADGNILYANPVSRTLIECWHSGAGQFSPNCWKQRIANTLASGESQETEIECGEMVISFHVVPVPDDSCVILYGRDVTERKHTERELRQNEERFALVLRGTNDGIWDFDLRTGEIQFSPRWEEMLGYQEREIANHFKAWQDLIYPEDLGQVLEVWMECMEGLTESFATEYRIRTKSGDWMWVQCRGLALQDADQSPIRLAGSHTDITDRKQAELLQIRYHEGLIKLDNWVRELIGVAGQSQKFFDLVCDGILDLVNADLGALPMIDESGDTFTYVAATGAMAKLVHNQTMLVQGGGLCGWVAEHGKTLRITDIANDSRVIPQLAKALDVTTALLVPIRQANQVAGGLSAFRKASPFDDIDEQLLTLFSQRVSAALDNLRLLVTLEDQKERAQVTLQSIGDAVITTDGKGHIDYMNPVAEQLTGWRNDEAKGLPATEVLHIIHETTREPVVNPVQECLREERTIELSSNTVLISRNGKEFAIEDAVAPIRDRKGDVIGAVMVLDNVSEERELKNQLGWQATHDALTGLFNRREFERRLGQVLANAREENALHALLYLDLDQFKIVNDTCGHVAGDILLKQLATILEDKLRQADIVARLGGDEFGVLLNHCPIKQAKQIANTLRQAIKRCQFLWEGKTFEVGVSVGVVPITADSGTQNDIMSAVDMACYAAKDQGRNRIYVYREEDSDLARRHVEMQWVTRINEALEADRFELYYQNIAPSAPHTSEGEHFEILVRMLDEDGNIVLPMDFIPAAERFNLMPAIDRWVISNTFAIIGAEQYALDNLATCAINLSGVSLGDESLLHFIREQLLKHGIPPNVICFEVTETAAIANLSQAVQFIAELKEVGCRFALDDFGSGLSSFSYLQTLPVDYLKIDGDFVKDMVSNPVDCAMVKSINEVGHAMGKQTIAEWAEDDATLQRLKEIGVDYAQGYAVGKPEPFPCTSKENNKPNCKQPAHLVTHCIKDSKLAS